MWGMQEQDPTVKILTGDDLGTQHYGIAIPHTPHEELARFVNGVLDRLRDDGSLAGLYVRWLGTRAPAIPDPNENRPLP